MSDTLAKICADKRARVNRRKAANPLSALDSALRWAAPIRPFAAALDARVTAAGYGLIAEIKKASPSAGLIRADFDPAMLARAYQQGGAACLSVLTEEDHFQGSDDALRLARAATTLPVLRKDFMLDPYQVVEARAIGADCILLIMAMLDDPLARELEQTAQDLGLAVLIEVHDQKEFDRALALASPLIGINNRDLKTLQVDLQTTEKLAPRLPAGRVLVCESGLKTPADLARMARCGARRFLIGEALMRQPDVAAATRALLTIEPIHA
jgi:indole-3-glycerol phosphate synthase